MLLPKIVYFIFTNNSIYPSLEFVILWLDQDNVRHTKNKQC